MMQQYIFTLISLVMFIVYALMGFNEGAFVWLCLAVFCFLNDYANQELQVLTCALKINKTQLDYAQKQLHELPGINAQLRVDLHESEERLGHLKRSIMTITEAYEKEKNDSDL